MKMFTLLALTLILASCGKNEPLNQQEKGRSALGPELIGNWESKCAAKEIRRVTVDDKKINFEKTNYFDEDCQERVRTVKHAATYTLSHNYKSGIENSIVLVPENDVKVTLFTDSETDSQNAKLTSVHNDTEKEIKETLAVQTKKDMARENMRIRSTKTLTIWKRDEEKTLNRLQLEKLTALGLRAPIIGEQGSLVPVRYEVDNGYLQLTGPADFGHVFQKAQ